MRVGRLVSHAYAGAQEGARRRAHADAAAAHGRRRRSPSCWLLIFSKYFYLASLSSYYTFYLIEKFGVSAQSAQLHLFVFLGAVAVGTLVGGPIGDRIGRKYVIWVSILGVLPFTLLLPYANLFWTTVLTIVIGLDPRLGVLGDHRLRAGAGAGPRRHDRRPVLRLRVRHGRPRRRGARRARRPHGIESVYALCAYLPAIGLLAWFLPSIEKPQKA